MKTPPASSPTPRSHDDPLSSSDDFPGVPGFRTWRGVYLFVFGCFILVVIALTIFSRVYA